MRLRTTVALLVLAGCDKWEPREEVDSGRACLGTSEVQAFLPAEPQTFDASSPIDVYVQLAGCLSSSCSRNDEASCTATRDGATITVQARATWEENVGAAACTEDCGALLATCVLGTLPDGTYTVVYGSESFELVIPSTQAACAGR